MIHVDIDPAEHNKVRRADVAIAGDCRLVIEELLLALEAAGLAHSEATRGGRGGTPSDAVAGAPAAPGSLADRHPRERLAPWRAQLGEWQTRFPLVYDQQPGAGPLKPQFVIEQLRDLTPEDTIVASGVGQHQMFASQWWQFDHPYTWVNSGGLGTMGFAVPSAIGAKVGRPDKMVWAVDGDGCFQMTAQELVTASSERIPVKIAILNNAYLGMVRQWQEMFYEERYSEVYLSPDLPDYVGWAEAMGCVGIRVESPDDVANAIDKANSVDDRPVVVDFRTDAFEKVFPMVAAGASNDDIMVDPSLTGGRAVVSVYGTDQHHHTLTVLVENKSGVLARVASLFSRRGYNIFSLAVAPSDDPRFSRITIVVDVESAPLDQIIKQLDKLIPVVSIRELDPAHARERELLLATVEAGPESRGQVIQLVGVFEGKIVDVGPAQLTVMLAGAPTKLDDFEDLIRGYGDRGDAADRTGRAAYAGPSRPPGPTGHRSADITEKAG